MRRIALLVFVTLLLGACAAGPRPPVVARDAGRVDGERSISTMSDPRWTIQKEPASEPGEPAPDTMAESPGAPN